MELRRDHCGSTDVMMSVLCCSGGGRGEKVERHIGMEVVKLCTVGVYQDVCGCNVSVGTEPNQIDVAKCISRRLSNDCVRVHNIIPGCLATRLPSF